MKKTVLLALYLSVTMMVNLFAGRVFGNELWRSEIKEKITGTACVTDDVIYITTWLNHLVALDRETGEELWKKKLDGHIPGGAVVDNGTLYIAAYKGKLYAIDTKTGEQKWMYDMYCSRYYATVKSLTLIELCIIEDIPNVGGIAGAENPALSVEFLPIFIRQVQSDPDSSLETDIVSLHSVFSVD